MSIFNIDKSALDEEWSGQPELYNEYAVKLANAKRNLEFRKSQLNVIKAKVALDIRRNPSDYGIPRVTDKIVESLVTVDPKVQKVARLLAKAHHSVDIIQAAVTALDHRKKALEGLVSLHGQNYFSTPRVRGPDQEAFDTLQKKSVRRKGIRRRK